MPAENAAFIQLLKLVAIHRVIQKVGEVRPQLHFVVDDIGAPGGIAVLRLRVELSRQAGATGVATQSLVERTQFIDQSLIHGALGDLIGRIPVIVIVHGRDAPLAVAVITTAEAKQAVQLLGIAVDIRPRSIEILTFDSGKELLARDRCAAHG